MYQTYDSYTAGKVATSLHSTKMFALKDQNFLQNNCSLEPDRGWSEAVEGLIYVEAPAHSINHAHFFGYEENIVALSDHLKIESEQISSKMTS